MRGVARTLLVAVLVVVAGALTPRGLAQSSLPIVPGAHGFGMQTRAAYGGPTPPAVLRVTNLNDSGAGSLRAALQSSGPRVVIFETSGTINLSSDILIRSPYLTVAGQTAPAPGITLKNYTLIVDANDVLLQHFRVRPGAATCNNGIQVWGTAPYNIVLDHMSVSWGQDENVVLYNPSRPINATVWRSIISEGLHNPPGQDHCSAGLGPSPSHGLLIYASTTAVSVIQTLFANNIERNPYMQAGTRTVLINNVIYHWYAPWGFFFANPNTVGGSNGPPWQASVVGNRFIGGPMTFDSSAGGACMFTYSAAFGNVTGNRIYRSDNTLNSGTSTGTITQECNLLSYNPNVSAAPAEAPLPTGFRPLTSASVEAFVLAHAGATPAQRDPVDARIVQEVRSRTGRFIRTQTEVGGWPVLAVNTRSLTVPSSPHSVTPSGYTALEVWLHGYATAVETESHQSGISAPTGQKLH
jgi:hypothetical protein